MSDLKLRKLERAAKAGDLDAHGRYLQEKIRLGLLNEEALEGLAYMLWPPAWKALGWQPSGHSGAPSESFRSRLFKREGQKGTDRLYQVYVRFERWTHGLRRWGAQASMRVGAAAARHRFVTWEEQYLTLQGEGWGLPCELARIEVLLHMVDLHIMNPQGYPLVYWPGNFAPRYNSAPTHVLEHEGRLLVSASPVRLTFRELEEESPRITPRFAGDLGIFAGRHSYSMLASCLQDSCDNLPMEHAQPCKACGHLFSDHEQGDCLDSHGFIPKMDDRSYCRHVRRREEAVFQAIRDELVPWVLGDRDPVADRLALNERALDKRQREDE